jgi:hypothetical protein
MTLYSAHGLHIADYKGDNKSPKDAQSLDLDLIALWLENLKLGGDYFETRNSGSKKVDRENRPDCQAHLLKKASPVRRIQSGIF